MIQSLISTATGRIGRLRGVTSSQTRRVLTRLAEAGTSAPVKSQCATTVIQPSVTPCPSSAACTTTA